MFGVLVAEVAVGAVVLKVYLALVVLMEELAWMYNQAKFFAMLFLTVDVVFQEGKGTTGVLVVYFQLIMVNIVTLMIGNKTKEVCVYAAACVVLLNVSLIIVAMIEPDKVVLAG
jgi:hypothetical protein